MRWVTAVGMLVLGLAAAAAAVATAQQGGREQADAVRVSFPQEDGSLTPYTFRSGYTLMSLVYDTLLLRDRRGVPRPWLARSVRRSADRRSVTVRLRRRARWHDGRPVTARDVAFTFGHLTRRPHPRFTPQLRDIASVSAVDRDTVVFRLRRPSLGFSDQPLADVPILPRHLWAGLPRSRLAPAGLPVGSGPYRLTEHTVGRRYRFDAVRGHFGGAPAVRRIDVPIVAAQAAAVDDLADRRLDAVPVALSPGVRRLAGGGVRLAASTSYTGTMLTFDVTRPPFDRVAVRRAVAAALDLRAIARAAGPEAVVADRGVVHPQSRWAAEEILHRAAPTAARRAFAERGVPEFRVLASAGDALRLDVAERVVRALTGAGARARLVTAAPAAYERALGHAGAPADFDAAVVGIPSLVSYDPAFLRAVFGDPASAPLNDGGYRSARFAWLADRVAAATTTSARRRAVGAQLRRLAADLPALPLFFGSGTLAYRPSAYAGWVDVRGSGPFDKRSFTDPATAASGAVPAAGDPVDRSSRSDLSLIPVILALVAVLLAAAVVRLRRRR